jgi:hypothetical protein
MTERVLRDTPTGRVVEYDESPEERGQRIMREATQAGRVLRTTRGQRRTLARRR